MFQEIRSCNDAHRLPAGRGGKAQARERGLATWVVGLPEAQDGEEDRAPATPRPLPRSSGAHDAIAQELPGGDASVPKLPPPAVEPERDSHEVSPPEGKAS